MNRRVLRPLAVSLLTAGLLAAGVFVVAHASTARFWRISTQAESPQGQSERLSIDYEAVSSWAPRRDPCSPPRLRSCGAWPRPRRLGYAGGGNDGLVWHVDRDGRSAWHSTRRNSRSTPSRRRPTGRCSWRPRRTASLPGRRGRLANGVLRSGGQVHLGARGGRAGTRLRRHGRQGRHLPRLRRRQGDVFYRTQTTNVTSLLMGSDGRSWRAPSRPDGS